MRAVVAHGHALRSSCLGTAGTRAAVRPDQRSHASASSARNTIAINRPDSLPRGASTPDELRRYQTLRADMTEFHEVITNRRSVIFDAPPPLAADRSSSHDPPDATDVVQTNRLTLWSKPHSLRNARSSTAIAGPMNARYGQETDTVPSDCLQTQRDVRFRASMQGSAS